MSETHIITTTTGERCTMYMSERLQQLIDYGLTPEGAEAATISNWQTHVVAYGACFYVAPYLPELREYDFESVDAWFGRIAVRFRRLCLTRHRYDNRDDRWGRRFSAEYYQLRDAIWHLSRHLVIAYFPFWISEWEQAQ